MKDKFDRIEKILDSHTITFRTLLTLLCALVIISFFSTPKINKKVEVPIPEPVKVSSEEIDRGRKDLKQVIFTFDGGAGNEATDGILKALIKHKVRGTFFLTGKWVEENHDLVARIHNEGHEIFSHTYSHPYLTTLSDGDIVKELNEMDNALFSSIGIHSKPYFRPPYGDRNGRVRDVAAKAGYNTVFWTVDARDWEESEGETDESVYNRIIENLSPGAIYLMHLGDSITGQILDNLFSEIESKGYKIVSLTEGI